MLESLSFYARVSHIAAGDLDVDMQHLPSLQKVDACLWSEENCSPAVKKVADLLELASNAHPNRLTFRWGLLSLPKEWEEETASLSTGNDSSEGEAVRANPIN